MALGFLKTKARKSPQTTPSWVPPAAEPEGEGRPALLVLAHPAIHRSRANAALLETVHRRADVTVHDLYRKYPDFLIDVPAEQKKLVAHPLIILQYPLYWYSTPALLKEWLDAVLLHGFAFGRSGTALRGKTLMVAVTAGGDHHAYRPEGINRYSMAEFLRPMEATAHLCGLTWAQPFVLHDAIRMGDAGRRLAADAYDAHLEDAIAQVTTAQGAGA
ncbi:NAD(P)H-dependent oxidoreductase [Acidisoma sp. 7E03]